MSSGQNVAILSGVVLNANIFQTIHRMETEIASVKRGERPLSNNTSFTIFAYNLVTTTQKTEQFTENKTPAQAFTLASVGQITSQVSFVSTSVPSTFLERREVVGFVYFFSWYALRIIQTKGEFVCFACEGRRTIDLLFRQHMLCFCSSQGKHANSTYIE